MPQAISMLSWIGRTHRRPQRALGVCIRGFVLLGIIAALAFSEKTLSRTQVLEHLESCNENESKHLVCASRRACLVSLWCLSIPSLPPFSKGTLGYPQTVRRTATSQKLLSRRPAS